MKTNMSVAGVNMRRAASQGLRNARGISFRHGENKSAVTKFTSIPTEADYNKLNLEKTNYYMSLNSAFDTILESDPTATIFGEDVGFGGVFRCTDGLQEKYGKHRVFSTPLSEQGIIGFAIGAASMGHTTIAEIQFADYIFPAFDQIVNEASKYRYRSGGEWDCGGLTIRTPCGSVGHGGHYHSQSVEAFFAHSAGLKLVCPRGPRQAKGLTLASVRTQDPVLIQEPKRLYRASIEQVPTDDYELPLGVADVMREGSDITILTWGAQCEVAADACKMAEELDGISCELIDLQTLLPWDVETVTKSIKKTGRAIVTHEAPITQGFGAELTAVIQEKCFLYLEAPIKRVCGYDTPWPLSYEKIYYPDKLKIYEGIKDRLSY